MAPNPETPGLDRLIERYEEAAILTVSPYYLDPDGVNVRWVAQIDGRNDPDVDVRLADDGAWRALLLVVGDDETVLLRWDPTNPTPSTRTGQFQFSDTLGALRRRTRSGRS